MIPILPPHPLNIILFDDNSWENLQPLTFTRPVCELRVGILCLREKWELLFGNHCSWLTREYLREKFPLKVSAENLLINGSVLASTELAEEILQLAAGEALWAGDLLVAVALSEAEMDAFSWNQPAKWIKKEFQGTLDRVFHLYDIFMKNGEALRSDFKWLTHDRPSAPISPSNRILEMDQVFLEEGVSMEFATINATLGPVYIGKGAVVMENSSIRGPFALLDHSEVKMGAKIYGPTTIGPHSKVGGELNNVVIQGYSNKGHDGFLGNSVLGEWVNIGADTNNSNLKNNYAEVRLWNYPEEAFTGTGLQFCGLIMGDHSKCAINTMFNTGTVVGVFANIFGSGFPRNFIPSFSWGGPQGMSLYKTTAAFYVARLVMERRGIAFSDVEKRLLSEVFRMTERYRRF